MFTAAVLCMLLRRASAASRHAVWVLAIMSALLLPIATAIQPQLQLPVLPQAHTSVRWIPLTFQAAIATTGRGAKPLFSYSAWEFLAFVWGVGLALLLLRLLTCASRLALLANSATGPRDETWGGMLFEVSHRMKHRKPVRLLFSAADVSPMTWGVWRHSVLMPSQANEWPLERKRLVLAHELAHVKRSDWILHPFIQLACGIYWFNPLIWYAARTAQTERERACDDQVLNLGATAEDYADHLVEIVRGRQARKSHSFAALAMAQRSQLESRLLSILDGRTRRQELSRAGTIVLRALTGLAMLSIAKVSITDAVPLPPILPVATTVLPPVAGTTAHIGNNETVTRRTLTRPQLIETAGALYAATEGTVTLEASVDAQGNVHVLRVVKGLNAELDVRAIDAVSNWKFSPALALKDAAPVAAITQIEVDFKKLPIRIAGNVRAPTVVSRVEPKYTDEGRAARYEGTVVLEAKISKNGSVEIMRVVHSVGYGLDESAIEALKQWVFRPATKNGQAVDVVLNIEVNFNLQFRL